MVLELCGICQDFAGKPNKTKICYKCREESFTMAKGMWILKENGESYNVYNEWLKRRIEFE